MISLNNTFDKQVFIVRWEQHNPKAIKVRVLQNGCNCNSAQSIIFHNIARQLLHDHDCNAVVMIFHYSAHDSNALQNDACQILAIPMHCKTVLIVINFNLMHCYANTTLLSLAV